MLKLDFKMPKRGRKTQKRDRSPSPEVSERSTESEIHTTTKEPEVEVAEPTLTQESSIGDTPVPPTQPHPTKKRGITGASGISGVSSLLDAVQMGQSTPRASLGDVSFSSLLRGATDSLSPSDYLNVPSIDDSHTQS